ncbi:MAG: hypothetical protein GMKNLPBB_00039 [Myxococcota bacterium]|nr:hypothetical protein [Myxococcota bacterium]
MTPSFSLRILIAALLTFPLITACATTSGGGGGGGGSTANCPPQLQAIPGACAAAGGGGKATNDIRMASVSFMKLPPAKPPVVGDDPALFLPGPAALIGHIRKSPETHPGDKLPASVGNAAALTVCGVTRVAIGTWAAITGEDKKVTLFLFETGSPDNAECLLSTLSDSNSIPVDVGHRARRMGPSVVFRKGGYAGMAIASGHGERDGELAENLSNLAAKNIPDDRAELQITGKLPKSGLDPQSVAVKAGDMGGNVHIRRWTEAAYSWKDKKATLMMMDPAVATGTAMSAGELLDKLAAEFEKQPNFERYELGAGKGVRFKGADGRWTEFIAAGKQVVGVIHGLEGDDRADFLGQTLFEAGR